MSSLYKGTRSCCSKDCPAYIWWILAERICLTKPTCFLIENISGGSSLTKLEVGRHPFVQLALGRTDKN